MYIDPCFSFYPYKVKYQYPYVFVQDPSPTQKRLSTTTLNHERYLQHPTSPLVTPFTNLLLNILFNVNLIRTKINLDSTGTPKIHYETNTDLRVPCVHVLHINLCGNHSRGHPSSLS